MPLKKMAPRRCRRLAGLPLVLLLVAGPGLAETFPLGDFFTGEHRASSSPRAFVAFGEMTLFAAADASHGLELWRTDGTALGSELIFDIAPGGWDSQIEELTPFDGVVYFSALNFSHGRELWRTDGTSQGTELVADLWPGPGASSPRDLTVVGQTLFFAASTPATGRELWKLPAGGTPQLVADLRVGDEGSNPNRLTSLNSRVAFSVYTETTGWELGLSDGTEEGTVIFDVNPTGSSNARPLGGVFHFLLYFEADTDEHGEEVWTLAPESGDINRISDAMPGPDSSNPIAPIVRGTSLLVNLETPEGRKLFRSNAGAPVEEWAALDARGPALLGSDILFVVDGDLWITDGLTPGAQLLASPNVRSFFPEGEVTYLASHQGLVFFFGDGGLWSSDGTVAGTSLASSLSWSLLSDLKSTGAELFASLDDGFVGTEPWILNGSILQRLGDLNRSIGDSNPTEFAVFDNQVFFAAEIDEAGRELAKWDGGATGAVLAEDIRPGEIDSRPGGLTAAGERLFFQAKTPSLGTELMMLEDAAGPSSVIDVAVGSSSSNPVPFATSGAELFFTVHDDDSVDQLWVTSSGTPVQLSSFTGSSISGVRDSNRPALLDNQLYFIARDEVRGEELWRSDGTDVDLVIDLSPGPQSSNPFQLLSAGDSIYWQANDGVTGTRLWRTDGTVQNTMAVTSDAFPVLELGEIVLIGKLDSATGLELWRTDGTDAGTTLLRDIWPGENSSIFSVDPSLWAVSGGRAYFTAVEPETGYELWTSDGTAAGTYLVRDIAPGDISSLPIGLTPLPNGELAFSAYSPDHGWELWRTNGTRLGTYRVTDIAPGEASSEPGSLTLYRDWVVFSARSTVGREPWAYNWTGEPFLFGDGFESGGMTAWSSTVP